MNGFKLMGMVAVVAALLTGCAETGGLLDASVNVGNQRGHHDNGRHEGEGRHRGHGDDD